MKLHLELEMPDYVIEEAVKATREKETIEPLNCNDVINWIFDNGKGLSREEKKIIIDLLIPKETEAEADENIYP